MMALALPFLWRLSPMVIAVGAMVVFYEGVPVVNALPLVDRIPLVGDLAIGRVGRARLDGARAESIQWQTARINALKTQAEQRRATQDVIDALERNHHAREAILLAGPAIKETIHASDLCGLDGRVPGWLSERIDRAGRI